MTNLAIIISRRDFRENDVLVSLYTKNYGKQVTIARGAKKSKAKLSSHIEPLTLVDTLIIPTKAISYLASSKTKESFYQIKNSYNKLQIAGKVLNIFNQSIKENEGDQKLFNYLYSWLKKIEESKEENIEYLFLVWMIRFLDSLGFLPNFINCQRCQKKLVSGKQFFNFNTGSLLCSNCQIKYQNKDLYQLSENAVKLFRFLSNNQEKIVVKKSLIKELNVFLYKFWKYYQS